MRKLERNHTPKVTVVHRKKKWNFVYRWIERDAEGKPIVRERASKIAATKPNRRLAEREAAKLEAEIARALVDMPWPTFCKRYREEHLSSLSEGSSQAWCTALNHLDEIVSPRFASDVNAATLSTFASELRKERFVGPEKRRRKPVKETSIASYLRQILAALSWGHEKKLLQETPKITLPKRAKGVGKHFRSRPIVAEEFERMIKAAESLVDAADWIRLLNGLWLGGLRLGEAISLTWEWTGNISVELGGKFPCFRVMAEGEKGHTDQFLPMAPEFADMLMQTPVPFRTGRVFAGERNTNTASKVIGELGGQAGVIVNRDGKTATAHDLRRAFGTRWAGRVMPAELQILMRHSSIETTLKYYVHLDADEFGLKLRRISGPKVNPAASVVSSDQPSSNRIVKDPLSLVHVEAEDTGVEPATHCWASDFESDR